MRSIALSLPLMLAACVAPSDAPVPPAPQAAPAPSIQTPAPLAAKRPEGPQDFILIGDARQGGVMRGTVPAGTRALSFDGASVAVDKDGQFLIAFDRDSHQTAILRAALSDGAVVTRSLSVAPGDWHLEYINAPYTGRATSAEFRRLRDGELAQIAQARAINAQSDGWRQNFRWPVTGSISSGFGSQRIYQGKPGSYHGGVDIRAKTGTPFVAPADGVVVLAAERPFTLEGYLLIVDHGMGLNSAFLHCSSLAVKKGDRVRQGQVLGTVGSSGRATGPHMHWGMKWRDSRLDPVALAGPMP